MNIKKSSKIDMVLKDAKVINGKIVDEDGVIVDLPEVFTKIYGEDVEFKLSVTRSTSEEIDIDEINDEEDEE